MTQVLTKHDNQWNMKYEKLVQFKRQNGHCVVPFGCEQDKAYGRWMQTQRSFYALRKMRMDRKALLDEIGFVWTDESLAARLSDRDKKWRQQHIKLIEFKQKSGNCLVPQAHKEDKSLGLWVDK